MPSHEQLINELEGLRLPDLQRRFFEITGEESRCPNKAFLIRRIRQVMQGETPEGEGTSNEQEPLAEEAVDSQVDGPIVEIPADEQEPIAAAPPPANVVPLKRRKMPTANRPENVRGRFKSMTIEELQAMYLDRVGRETGSDNRAYLVWKIREAEKGRIPVGPRGSRVVEQDVASEMRILPMRLDAHAVEQMDAAWRAKGMKNRMEFFRRALGSYLEQIGAHSAAQLFETRQEESSFRSQ